MVLNQKVPEDVQAASVTDDPMANEDSALINIGFHDKQAWKSAVATYSEHSLEIFGHPVMEDWEIPYMKELAGIATTNGGTVLEVGYGMGLSAHFIQEHPISKHVIIEANHEVANKARELGKTASREVVVLEGLWEEIIDQIPDTSIDGILFDTYPLAETELRNHFPFFPFAFKKLKAGGVFTYFSDEERGYQPLHFGKLLAAGFVEKNITGKVVDVNTPVGCKYWHANTIFAPIVVK